ncbi:MAG TPA: PepSY domain-containing protein [Sphingomonas sp.]|uniref:PepSY domain-containing protein n=1 Tax=Sphingomonas sp. TaxID=28214 RepID=UPI002BE7A73A|nr:PepSY domain-containing protein [Sphingomonas sp.]HMI19939.1 PepSY domain-containing protein [Sphingomonas sp.]
MLRSILFIHRWLGVVIGFIMTIWCLSGFVMMYSDYPRLMPAEQLHGLSPLTMPSADALKRIDLPPDTALWSAKLEMLDQRPVLRIIPAIDPDKPLSGMRALPRVYDLATGKPLAPLSVEQVRHVGALFAKRLGIAGAPVAVTPIKVDQWTVQVSRNQPLYRIDFDDSARSTIYVAGSTGEVVQQTTGRERFWGWLGSVPHWLYPTILRANGPLWDQVVVWTSLTGCFLTVTGLFVGVMRLRRDRAGKLGSPYGGIWWWHHMFGLFFGVLTLTWVASGLFSMNPWGFLDSTAGFAERNRLAGHTDWADVRAALSALPSAPAGAVRLETAPLGGAIYIAATTGDGRVTRLDYQGRVTPLDEATLRKALANGPAIRSLTLLRDEDSYYYSHRYLAKLPVWRGILADEQRTRLYIDPSSGIPIQVIDRGGRNYRWLMQGLHDLDLPVLRSRPLWDIIVLPLLTMVTAVCATGTWMGFRKVKRDFLRARRRSFRLFSKLKIGS